jgi:hypothetical protein
MGPACWKVSSQGAPMEKQVDQAADKVSSLLPSPTSLHSPSFLPDTATPPPTQPALTPTPRTILSLSLWQPPGICFMSLWFLKFRRRERKGSLPKPAGGGEGLGPRLGTEQKLLIRCGCLVVQARGSGKRVVVSVITGR